LNDQRKAICAAQYPLSNAAIIRNKISSAGMASASANAGSRACSAIDDPSNGTMEKGSIITWD